MDSEIVATPPMLLPMFPPALERTADIKIERTDPMITARGQTAPLRRAISNISF